MGLGSVAGTLECCFVGLRTAAIRARGEAAGLPTIEEKPAPQPPKEVGTQCSGCSRFVEEFSKGAGGRPLCRACLREQDEELLQPSSEEQKGLDLVAEVLDTVPWKYWKPGSQPAEILDWLYLGDLKEAIDIELLEARGITAVLNLINWWELQARLPEGMHLECFYSNHGILYQEIDSEDRLFYEIVGSNSSSKQYSIRDGSSWAPAQKFLSTCRSEGRRVLVNCQAGHNRSACICVCWLLVREEMSLCQAIEQVQRKRGTILSNHGFRLQLVRLAMELQRVGQPSAHNGVSMVHQGVSSGAASEQDPEEFHAYTRPYTEAPDSQIAEATSSRLRKIIAQKRLSIKYDSNSQDRSAGQPTRTISSLSNCRQGQSLICEKVNGFVSQKMLTMELVACLVHWNQNFMADYDYSKDPPVVVGSGFSGDVVLCKRRGATGRGAFRCVKRFSKRKLMADHIEKLKNEAVIYLSISHPHIARLFDVYEDDTEISLVMQYCSGGTLMENLQAVGKYQEADFQVLATQMLRVVNYIHIACIVHRDIKPSNWVFETPARLRLKLIDFGFSVKEYFESAGGLKGCLGTLGYLAPEVVQSGSASRDVPYTLKCDIWSLGAVFYELLAGQPAFHRDRGTCDGYTEEVVLREIEDVTAEQIGQLLRDVPGEASAFLGRLLCKSPEDRPSAGEVLGDAYLASARQALAQPQGMLPIDTIVDRFRSYGQMSMTTRASLLAMARSPTQLPWPDFCQLRATFDAFDAAQSLTGSVDLQAWIAVVAKGEEEHMQNNNPFVKAHSELYIVTDEKEAEPALNEAREIWESVAGENESLRYTEFLAALLPPIEDAFEDVDAVSNETPRNISIPRSPASFQDSTEVWSPHLPISQYLNFLVEREQNIQDMTFDENVPVLDVVRAMSEAKLRWVIVRYGNGGHKFFDYMDVTRQLVISSSRVRGHDEVADAMGRMRTMKVGMLANCSGHCAFMPMPAEAPLSEVLRLIARAGEGSRGLQLRDTPVRRVPIVDTNGRVLRIFSCLDFLQLALRFSTTAAVLQSRAAKTFDCRDRMIEFSVMSDATVLDALKIMDQERLTICPVTSRELSGNLGGVAAINVISVADLKWVVKLGNFGALDQSVGGFTTWRHGVVSANEDVTRRRSQLKRFNVVSVDADDSVHGLANRLLASQLQRIFLSSRETSRLVGVVSSRDILMEVLDDVLEPNKLRDLSEVQSDEGQPKRTRSYDKRSVGREASWSSKQSSPCASPDWRPSPRASLHLPPLPLPVVP